MSALRERGDERCDRGFGLDTPPISDITLFDSMQAG
jgi:hypothetical protein